MLTLQGPGSYSGPVDVREGTLRVQNDTALGQAGSGTNAGSEVFTQTATTVEAGAGLQLAASSAANNGGLSGGIEIANERLILNGAAAQVAVAGPPTGGTFTLSYTDANGVTTTTAPLNYPLPATSNDSSPTSSVQNALNALLATADPNGTATVTLAGNVYTIVFGGNLLGQDPTSFLSATGANDLSLTVGGTAATLKNLSDDNARLALAGPTSGGSFTLSYTNTATGVVTKSTSIPYGAPLNVVQNALTTLLTSVDPGGTGTVTLGNHVTSTGIVTQAAQQYKFTFDGNLRGVNPQSFFSAAGAGGVTLALTVNQAADNLWRGPITLMANANVDVGYNSRLTLFGAIDDGTPAGFTKTGLGELALYGASSYRGVTNINQGVVTIGNSQALGSPAGGTMVANGATLQTTGNITIGGEPLTLMGSGLGIAPTNVPLQWFSAGPGPINNGPTPNNLPVSGRVTGIAVDPSDAKVIYIATAGGGAWKTIDDGKTWHPLFDNTSEAQVTVTGTSGGFTLTFNGFSTPNVGPGSLPFNATATQVATALNLLPSIGGIGGSVSVTSNPIKNGTIFTINYGGTLAQGSVPALTAIPVGAAVVNSATVNPSMFAGAIAIDPSDPRIIYLGTGEADNSPDSYYGTGVYKSTDSGRTWSLLFDPNPATGLPSNPIYGLGVSRIAVDPTGNNIIYVATSDQAHNGPPKLNPVPGVYRFDGGTSSWYDLTGTPSITRQFSTGQLMAPPNTPGPDDDFTLSFAQSANSWSDLSLAYVNKAPVLYAAQGYAPGSPSNAVFRTPTPDPTTSGPTTPPVWFVGTQGAPASETQEITLTEPTPGTITFYFPGPQPKGPKTISFSDASVPYDPTKIVSAIQGLTSITGVKGTLTVSNIDTTTPGTVIFDVTFGGTMANTAEPLITAVTTGGTTFANVVKVQANNPDGRTAGEFPTGASGNIKFSACLMPRRTTWCSTQP